MVCERAGYSDQQRLTAKTVFDDYRVRVSELDQRASARIDEAGRTELGKLWQDPSRKAEPNFQSRSDELQGASYRAAVPYLVEGDQLAADLLAALSALGTDKQREVVARIGRDLAVFESYKDYLTRGARMSAKSPIADWVDVIAVIKEEREPKGLLSRVLQIDEGRFKASTPPEKQPLGQALDNIERAYVQTMLPLAEESMKIMRMVPRKEFSSDGAADPKHLKRLRLLKAGRMNAAAVAVEGISAELAERGFKDEAREWSQACWKDAAPDIFRGTTCHPDVRKWMAGRVGLPPDTVIAIESHLKEYDEQLLTLRLKAVRAAIQFATDSQTGSEQVAMNYYKSLAAIWRWNASHLRATRALLDGDNAIAFIDTVGDTPLDDPMRMPLFPADVLAKLSDQRLLPSGNPLR